MDLTISTSCWNYGHYVEEWADAICAMEKYPKAVCMVDNGSTDSTAKEFEKAAKRFRRLGIDARIQVLPKKVGFSRARNISIGMGKTEWCMHLDVDDLIEPNALVYAEKYEGRADVIQFAYQAFGAESRKSFYTGGKGKQILFSSKPASAVSPFRRWLWEKSPYDETMPGSMDTALWIGFCHLDARFVATKEICYRYRIHPTSLFHGRSALQKQRLGLQLMALRYQSNPLVSIIVPHRYGCPYRDAAWAWLKKRYQTLYPWWEIVECTDDGDGTWNKAKAVNDGVKRAKGDILMVSDSDVVVPDKAILDCVDNMIHGVVWAIPHRNVVRLDEGSTASVLKKAPDTGEKLGGNTIRDKYVGVAGGGLFFMLRSAFMDIGGFDERFEGWGGEDLAFGIVATSAYGNPKRYGHDLIHLYHPYQPTKKGRFGDNEDLGMRYWNGRNNSFELKNLIAPGIANFPGYRPPLDRYYACFDLTTYERQSRGNPLAPKFREIKQTMAGQLRTGVFKMRNAKFMAGMGALPCVRQITKADYETLLAR